MMIQKGRYAFLLALAALIGALLLSACTAITTGTTSSNLSVGTVLQNSVNAMQKLKSAHFVLTLNGSVQGVNAGTPTTTGAGTPTANQLSFNLTGKGDESIPDQQQSMTLSVNQALNLTEIVKGSQVYIQNTKGQWYVIDASKLQQAVGGNPFAGVNVDTNTLLGLAVHAKLVDHGDEMLNGQSLRHITAILDKEGLRQLLKSSPQLSSMFGQQNIDEVINNTKTFESSLDLWIDESQFYVHRTELKVNLNADLSALATPAATITTLPMSITTTLNSTVDLSNFNKPVTITPPANAIPTDNLITIFQ